MMDIYSIMKEPTANRSNQRAESAAEDESSNLSARIAQRVHGLRTAQRISLDTLAARSGVSRSMISLIERNETSPTAVVLEKLATGLNVVLATLFETPATATTPDRVAALSRRADQASWRDPTSGYLRRNVSPEMAATSNGLTASPIQIVDVVFPAGARVGNVLCSSAIAGKDAATGQLPPDGATQVVHAFAGIRPLVADVRLKDADGKPGRRVFVRLDKEAVDAGDVVAINEGDKPGAPRTGPLRARDRLSHIEAKHDTAYARNFFRPATPDFLALRKDD